MLVLPGHAPGHLCLQGSDHVVGGDLLIAGITPNPIFEVGPSGRRPSLQEYRTSLARVRRLPVVTWLPGHRECIEDPLSLIASYEHQMTRRQARLLSLLQAGPKSAFSLSQDLFPLASGADPFLAISETLGQLDGLLTSGSARTFAEAHEILFAAV
jgi:glyoxylase-like metal-dependent hydrolase (beta-lactamase superfamily II)